VTDREHTLRRLNLVWGIRGLLVAQLPHDIDEAYAEVEEALKAAELVQPGDYVVYTAGLPLGARGYTNSLKVAEID
jgi:pyruvate kinase